MSSLTTSTTVTCLCSPLSCSRTVSQRTFGVPGVRSLRKSKARSASAASSTGS